MRQNFVFIQTADLNQLTLQGMLRSSLLSLQAIKQASTLPLNRQKQFIACRYLLAELLNEQFSITSLPEIVITENNRPQFKRANLPDFNISHSGDFVAVALCTAGKIGLDIELDRSRNNALTVARQIFSDQENHWLIQQSDPLAAFWQLWTLRESALKLYAKGVWQMKQITITMPQQSVTATFADQFYPYHQKLDSIYLSLCCNQPIHTIVVND